MSDRHCPLCRSSPSSTPNTGLPANRHQQGPTPSEGTQQSSQGQDRGLTSYTTVGDLGDTAPPPGENGSRTARGCVPPAAPPAPTLLGDFGALAAATAAALAAAASGAEAVDADEVVLSTCACCCSCARASS
eukprot:1138735-Pelagomonas_calceolata.AAC.5